MKPFTPPTFNPGQGPNLKAPPKTNLVKIIKVPETTPPSTTAQTPNQATSSHEAQGGNQISSVSSNSLISSNKVNDVENLTSTQIPPTDHQEPPSTEAVFQPTVMSPQMLLHFFQSRSTETEGSESGVIIPMVFTPPQVPPPRSSKAVYQRSPN